MGVSSYSSNILLLGLAAIVVLQSTCGQAQTFDCYRCSSTIDATCITQPDAVSSGDVTVSNCTGWCTIVRVEFTDIPGQVVSLIRDCERNPLVRNDIRTDAHYTKYYTACNGNRCNSGDGILIGTGDGGINLPSEVMVVEEKSRGTQLLSSSLLLCFILIVMLHSSF